MMAPAIEAWITFWFAPTSPVDLGVSRFILFGFLFLYYRNYSFSAWSKVSRVFWRPHPLFRRLRIRPLKFKTMRALETLWKAFLLFACMGFLTPVSVAASFLLGFYLLGLPDCFMKIRHNKGLPVVIMGILSFSKCGHAFSLDRLIFHDELSAAGADYTWPVRLVWLVLSLSLFAAGFSKLKTAGFSWASGTNLSYILREVHYWRTFKDPLVSWGLSIAEHKSLCFFIGALSLLIETGYPLAMIWPESRWFFIPSAVMMFAGFRLLMGTPYLPFIICQCFWVPWSEVQVAVTELAASWPFQPV